MSLKQPEATLWRLRRKKDDGLEPVLKGGRCKNGEPGEGGATPNATPGLVQPRKILKRGRQ
jgi:hypothetical protein